MEMLESAAGILKSDDAPTVSGKVTKNLLAGLTPDLDELRTIEASFASPLGLPEPGAAPDLSQADLQWGVRFSRARPTCRAVPACARFLEDLHWAELDAAARPDRLPLRGDSTDPRVIGSARRELIELRPELPLGRW